MEKNIIGILGAIGYDDYGDDALLLCNVEELLMRNYKIIIFSYNPTKTISFLISMGILPLNALSERIEVVSDLNKYADEKKWLKYLNFCLNFKIDAIKTIYYQYLLLKLFKSIPTLQSDDSSLSEFIRNVSKCSCILNIGGGYLNHYHGAKIYSHILTHCVADKMGKKVVAYGQTIGPFNRIQKYLIKKHIKKIHHISVRDIGRSRSRLIEVGFPENRISEGPDDAIFMNWQNQDYLKQFEGKFIVTTNFGLFLKFSKMPLESIYQIFAEFFDYIIENMGAIILNISMTSSGADVSQGLNIQKLMKNNQSFFHLPLYVGVREIKSIIKSSNLVFSTRLHPIVFAVSEKIPYIGISSGGDYYDAKLMGISEIYGYDPSRHIINADNLSFDLLLWHLDIVLNDSYVNREDIYFSNQLKRKEDLDNISDIIKGNY